uniref:Uncharacterized protein n=1 Tax=Echinococcus granulosus TaxID=6210 RepID=A0A068WBK9_ECHGR|nr:hypothetical protein EgrG_002017300 [Echinococcus granulosus]
MLNTKPLWKPGRPNIAYIPGTTALMSRLRKRLLLPTEIARPPTPSFAPIDIIDVAITPLVATKRSIVDLAHPAPKFITACVNGCPARLQLDTTSSITITRKYGVNLVRQSGTGSGTDQSYLQLNIQLEYPVDSRRQSSKGLSQLINLSVLFGLLPITTAKAQETTRLNIMLRQAEWFVDQFKQALLKSRRKRATVDALQRFLLTLSILYEPANHQPH